jgi:predicted component of type VI protein secretion system
VPSPQLMVNGRPQRSADLQDGDVFTIGKFEFQVHVPQPMGALQAQAPPEVAVPESVDDLSAMSASKLVALIEAEQQQVAELEQGRLNGARALLDAVQRAATNANVDATSSGEFVISFPQANAVSPSAEPATTDEAVALTTRRAS